MDHICTVLCISYGILGDICLYIAELEIVACIEHTAECITAALYKVILLCCCTEHLRSVKILCKHRLRDLRPEIAQIYAERVTACCLDIGQSLLHMDLTLNDAYRALIDIIHAILVCISLYQRFAAVN